MAYRHSKAIRSLLVINLPGMKALYIGPINSFSNGLSLLIRHLDTTL
jgi:hypothetical protein